MDPSDFLTHTATVMHSRNGLRHDPRARGPLWFLIDLSVHAAVLYPERPDGCSLLLIPSAPDPCHLWQMGRTPIVLRGHHQTFAYAAARTFAVQISLLHAGGQVTRRRRPCFPASGHPETTGRGYMSNKQFTWQAPFILQDQTDLPRRT